MEKSINLNLRNLQSTITENQINNLKPMITAAHNVLHNRTGAGNDFLGWVDLPINYDKDEFERIKKAAKKIKKIQKFL